MAKQHPNRNKARTLFLSGEYNQAEIAEMCGVNERTIREWKEADKWEDFKISLLTSKENELKRLYLILQNLNDNTLKDIDAGKRIDSKDADAVIKYSAAIKNLEVETSISEKVEVGKDLINLVRKEDVELSKQITKWFDIYLKSSMK